MRVKVKSVVSNGGWRHRLLHTGLMGSVEPIPWNPGCKAGDTLDGGASPFVGHHCTHIHTIQPI